MFVIFESHSMDWQPVGYVETEEEAKIICEKHNEHIWSSSFEWYYLQVNPVDKERIDDVYYCYRR